MADVEWLPDAPSSDAERVIDYAVDAARANVVLR